MSNLKRAIQLACDAHDGQLDKQGEPYILHPLQVMLWARTEEERIVAVLHDVLEDCRFVSVNSLRNLGYSERVIAALVTLTHKDGESYGDYIERVIQNPLAARVKLLDLRHNLGPARKLEVTVSNLARLEKYRQAKARIEESLVVPALEVGDD